MKIIRYETPQEEVEKLEGTVIFLAGPTVRGNQTHLLPSWRTAAIQEFKELGFDGTIIIPEFESPTESDQYRYDLPLWEYAGLKRANCIMFWVARTKELIALTTNWELGYWVGKDVEKVIFGRPDDAYRINYGSIMWDEVHREQGRKARTYTTLEDTVKASITRAYLLEALR